jgi:N-methylhydantoinase B/oxoprolinase/acetone carboxylase alpha subunit
MNGLQTELNRLSDQRLEYVMARSRVNSGAQAIRDSGISRATFYSWSQDERDKLDEIAQQIKRSVAIRIINKLEEHADDAVMALIGTLKSRNENIKQKAAIEILDRVIGKSTQRVEADITSGGKTWKDFIGGEDAD